MVVYLGPCLPPNNFLESVPIPQRNALMLTCNATYWPRITVLCVPVHYENHPLGEGASRRQGAPSGRGSADVTTNGEVQATVLHRPRTTYLDRRTKQYRTCATRK
jgi:hypothetical protein